MLNIGGNILNKIFDKLNNTLKRLYIMIKVGSFQGCKDGSINTNKQT
jgi:hypothetical protein